MIVELLGSSMDLTTLVSYGLSLLPLIGMAESDPPPPPSADPPPPAEVQMSQKAFDSVIDDRIGKVRVKMEAEYKVKEDDFNKKIKDLTEKIEGEGEGEGKNKPDQAIIDAAVKKATGGYETKVKELDDQIKELNVTADKESSARKQQTKRAAVITMLTDLKVLKPEDVYGTLEFAGLLGYDEDGKLIPTTEDGNAVIGGEGKTMPLDKYIEKYIDARPHLIAPSGITGSGADIGAGGVVDGKGEIDEEDFMSQGLKEAEQIEGGKAAFVHGQGKNDPFAKK